MRVVNKKAKFNYEILERYEAGIVLSGAEVKAIRANKVDYLGSYVRPLGGEMFVVNLHVGIPEGDTRRSRKLLLNKKEIRNIELKLKADRLTAVPLALYNRGPNIKLEFGLARGKRKHEKRAQIKKRDIERDIDRELSSRA